MSTTELLTDEDRIRLFANALADERDHFPAVKLFTPDAGATEVRGRLGLPVERDLHFVGEKPLSAYADDARVKGRIVA